MLIKNRIFALAIIMILVAVFPESAVGSGLTIQFNGRAINFDPAPVVENGQCLVPLRSVMEAMGAKLSWNQETNTVTASKTDFTLAVIPGSKIVKVNGQDRTLPVAPSIKNNSVFVPLRAIAEISNASVSWNPETATASIYSNNVDADIQSSQLDHRSQMQDSRDTVHQVSMFNALLEGLYDGQVLFEDLKNYGDTGIGTFEGLDGEMIELDGKFYQVKADGIAYPVADTMKTPFSSVTFFEADKTQAVNEEMNFERMQKSIDNMINNKNIFYAIKVTGEFKYVKTRSVPGQRKPYPALAEVTKNQPTFEFNNVKGTLVGFWCPSYVEGLNVPGYHVHFLNAYKNAGGHLLDFTMESGQIEIDATANFSMSLPVNEEFGQMDMARDRSNETKKVEK